MAPVDVRATVAHFALRLIIMWMKIGNGVQQLIANKFRGLYGFWCAPKSVTLCNDYARQERGWRNDQGIQYF